MKKAAMADEEQEELKKRAPKKRDEDPVGKVYDARLVRRLGHYLRPYWIQATVSSLAVSFKSLSDVTGPYLVKVAIDRYLTGNSRSEEHTSELQSPCNLVC